jgi:2-(1,2-epoxy-1,2-dihydrophenyl)acetyl-CoA isomerase
LLEGDYYMSDVLVELKGRVAIVTLNNEATYNALHTAMINELRAVIAELERDPKVRALVLTGAGRGFCSGASLAGDSNITASASDGNGSIADRIKEGLNPLLTQMRSTKLPILVAVNGAVAGAGVGLALAGDIVLAARSAKFILSFIRIAASMDAGTSLVVQRLVGPARARALAMLGEAISADCAESWGLIWKAIDNNQLMEVAMTLAEQVAASSPLAIGRIKRQIEEAWATSFSETIEAEAEMQRLAFMSEDIREGVAAFREKRNPVFTGR